ncbi:MAG: rod-binding protein [Deltaproteobacteria bacterium]|nr:rod-binding protein [Deltaproteobacteria bacterium]MBW2085349.1 rod-binding protein [Deltaproteobacteria bacterium]
MGLECEYKSFSPLRCEAATLKAAQKGEQERLARLKESCADVESLFISILLKTLRQTIPVNGLLPKSSGRNVYESMFDQQVSIFLSQGKGIGLGQMLYQQMLRQNDLNRPEETERGEASSGIYRNPQNDRQGPYKGTDIFENNFETFIHHLSERI